MRYRVGHPFWKFFARNGAKLAFRVGVKFDTESKVFYVAWSDLPGLNTDAQTLDELSSNIQECADLLLDDYVKDHSNVTASMIVPVQFKRF